MDVSPIVTRLTAEAGSFAQVVEASLSGNPPMEASQAALYSLFSGLVGGRMYPVQAKEQGAYPEIIYQLSSSYPETVGGYEVTRTDFYAMAVLSTDYDELLTLQGQIFAACSGQNISITNVGHDYYDAEGLYALNIELSYSYIATALQTTPVAFVYPVSRSASPSAFDNFIRQRVDQEFAVAVVTDGDNLQTLLNEVQAALVGWQQSADHHEVEYASGASIESVGGLTIWRESYRDAYYIQQS